MGGQLEPVLATGSTTGRRLGPARGWHRLVLGLLTRLAALGIIVIMGDAIATVHWPHGFSVTNGGFEYNAAIIVMCLCLVLGGPGPIAVDRVFRRRPRDPAAPPQ